MVHDWMTENLAYDNYMTTVLKKTRMSSYNDYTGTWHVYNTHTGVCRDFVNIFAIMCRELGVPCGSLDSDNLNHTWSIVYLDGEWWEVDLTKDIKKHTYKEDINDISGTITVCYQYFLKLSPITNFDNVDYVNDDIVCASFRLTGECNNCIHTN
jgi:transglutaminase/protease-like cytokinesis protein 3